MLEPYHVKLFSIKGGWSQQFNYFLQNSVAKKGQTINKQTNENNDFKNKQTSRRTLHIITCILDQNDKTIAVSF